MDPSATVETFSCITAIDSLEINPIAHTATVTFKYREIKKLSNCILHLGEELADSVTIPCDTGLYLEKAATKLVVESGHLKLKGGRFFGPEDAGGDAEDLGGVPGTDCAAGSTAS